MDHVQLRAVSRACGANRDLISGRVVPAGLNLTFEQVPVLVDAFRRMVRTLEWDVCEMAFTTYLCARAHGVEFTALPIFLVRGLHHGTVRQHMAHPLARITDLERRRVAVGRGWTVTTGVWARGILADEYGVDLAAVEWVREGDEHVGDYVPPDNVVDRGVDDDLEAMLAAGELAAAVNMGRENPELQPLIADPMNAAFAALERDGLYPINHLVVVRNDVLRAHPGLAVELFSAFAEAKSRYVGRLGTLGQAASTTDRMHQRIAELTGADPLPYGIDPNLEMIDRLLGYAVSQGILDERPDVGDLFARESHNLVA